MTKGRPPEKRLQPPSAQHERRGGSLAAAGRFFGELCGLDYENLHYWIIREW